MGDMTTGAVVTECVKEEVYPCEDAPDASHFCGYLLAACMAHDIETIYCEALTGMCRAENEACLTCFYLSNTCVQTGTDCADLYFECGCVAQALGVE